MAAGSQGLGSFSAASAGRKQRAGLEMEQVGHELVPMLVGRATG